MSRRIREKIVLFVLYHDLSDDNFRFSPFYYKKSHSTHFYLSDFLSSCTAIKFGVAAKAKQPVL